MRYIISKNIKTKLHQAGKQITKDGLLVLDVKMDEFLDKVIKQWNGHHSRITAELIRLITF